MPADLNLRPDVLIVGGGALGLAVGAFCRRAGIDSVVVLERDHLAAHASGGAAGLFSPEPHAWDDPPALVELARYSMGLTRELDDEWGGAFEFRDMNYLLAGRTIKTATMPFAVEVRDLVGDEVRQYEPLIENVDQAVLIRNQGHVQPLRFVLELASRAGLVATGAEVLKVRRKNGRAVQVDTSIGQFSPGVVVFATGASPSELVPIPSAGVKGHFITTAPVDLRLSGFVDTWTSNACQLSDGRILSGGLLDEDDQDPGVCEATVQSLHSELCALIPRLSEVEVSHAWSCFRPIVPDRLPLIDRVPGASNIWFTAGHYKTGITVAAATGEAISRWILTGVVPSRAVPFGLARFG